MERISPSVSASCPLPAPPLIFFFFLSFNLISSNSTFVVNRRHAGISQSPPRNQLVKKPRPALGKQAAGASPASPPLPPAAGSRKGNLAPGPLCPESQRVSLRRPSAVQHPAGRGLKGLGNDHSGRLRLSVSASAPRRKVYQNAGSQENEKCFQHACLRVGPRFPGQRHCSCSQAAGLPHQQCP